MLALLEKPAPTPTGLDRDDVGRLSERDRRLLAAWIRSNAGGEDKAVPFVPNAVRRLTLESRLILATDARAEAAWQELERRRVIAEPVYFTEAYGHLQPPVGPPIPFDLWPEQRQAAADFREFLRVICLKARQLGLTWLALHDAFHLLAFDPTTPNARVLVLSKHGGDASKLILRVRKIRELMPPFLRPIEASDTRRALSRFGLDGRGEIVSLAGTPEAARSETATLVILDEFGFMRNRNAGPTLTAVLPTLGALGRLIILSTGNGPEEAPGDGQSLAVQWSRARSGESGFRAIFLPASVDPARRSAKWRRETKAAFDTPEEFAAEHPETEEEALMGRPGSKVYPPDGVNAAVKLGRLFDVLRSKGKLPQPATTTLEGGRKFRGLAPGIDWGEQTVGLLIWALEQGGIYVPPSEVVHSHKEPGQLVGPLLDRVAAFKQPLADARFDAAGVQSMRTFAATARRKRAPNLSTTSIPFSTYKRETLLYLRGLLQRTAGIVELRELLESRDVDPDDPKALEALKVVPGDAALVGAIAKRRDVEAEVAEALEQRQAVETDAVELTKARLRLEQALGDLEVTPDDVALVRVLAISPGNPELLRQMRGLEFADDDSGKVEKGDDHAPDALLAGSAPIARSHRSR